MGIYRTTFKFSGGGEGWTETHYFNSTGSDFNAFRAPLGAIASLRAQMLGDPFYVWGVRVSQYSDGGVPPTRVARGARLWKGDPAAAFAGWYNLNFGKANNGAEPSEVALQAIAFPLNTVPAGLLGHQAFTSLGGPVDAAVDNNGSVFIEKAGLGAAFNQWASALIKGNFGWVSPAILADLEITTILQNMNGTVQITVVAPVPVGVVQGQTYVCRIRNVNEGRSPLNRELLLTYSGANAFVSKRIIGIPSAQVNGNVKVYAQVGTFIPYGQIDLGLVSIKHKRGKSPAARPGRLPRRILG